MADDTTTRRKDVPTREISKDTRNHIYLTHSIGPAIMIVISLGVTIAAFAGWDLFGDKGGDPANGSHDTTVYLCISLVVLVAAPVWAWYSIRRALGLAKRGVEVAARVVYVSKVSKNGMVGIRYAFTYKQVKVEKGMTAAKGAYRVGDELLVITDPVNPRTCMPKEEVFRSGQE